MLSSELPALNKVYCLLECCRLRLSYLFPVQLFKYHKYMLMGTDYCCSNLNVIYHYIVRGREKKKKKKEVYI